MHGCMRPFSGIVHCFQTFHKTVFLRIVPSGAGMDGESRAACSQLLVIDSRKDGLRVDDLLPGLLADDQCVRHQVVDHAGIALCVPVDGG